MTETTKSPASSLLSSLRALDDDQIGKLRTHYMTNRLLSTYEGPLELILDAMVRFQLDVVFLLDGERTRRRNVLTALEADLAGGHLVSVGSGNHLEKFAGYCDPRPASDEYCWIGPDRETIEEAMVDARRHSGGVEPRVAPSVWS